MAIQIKAPQFPESIEEGSIATWHKQVGEAVSRDELIVDIETDKTVLEVVAACLLYTSPSPRDRQKSRMPSSA